MAVRTRFFKSKGIQDLSRETTEIQDYFEFGTWQGFFIVGRNSNRKLMGSKTSILCMSFTTAFHRFRLITGDMQLLNVDMQQFNSYLYESLLALDEVRSEDFHFALDTLDEILSRSKKTMIPSRLLALCKRLFTLLLSVDSESALRMFPTIRFVVLLKEINKTEGI